MIRSLKKATTRGACKKGVFRNFAKFTGKKTEPESLLLQAEACSCIKKGDSGTGVFL